MITNGSGDYSVEIKRDENEDKNNLGPVTSRFFDDVKLNHPVENIETLKETTHLTRQLHEQNRRQHRGDWPFENDGFVLFCISIIKAMGKGLDAEGIAVEEVEMPTRRFKLVFLKMAGDPVNLKEFYNYIRESDEILSELGYPDKSELECYDTIRLELKDRLPNEFSQAKQEALQAAVTRTVFAVYRNGVKVPPQVSEKFNFESHSPPLDEGGVGREEEKSALRNWVRMLIDETIHPLNFGRSDPGNTFNHYIGALAASALYGCGLQEVPNVSDYAYPRDNMPKGSGFGKYVRDDELPLDGIQATLENCTMKSITEQFDSVHSETLQLVSDLGFFDEPRSLASDLYRIEWNGQKKNEATINRPPKSENDISSEWTFAIMGIVDNEARFTLGARWMPKKSYYPDRIAELRSIAEEFIDVDDLYADSELISGRLIEEFEQIAGPDWVVRAPNKDIIKKLKKYTPENHIGYVPNIHWRTTSISAAVAYPYESNDPSLIEFTERELKKKDPTPVKKQTTLSDVTESNRADQSLRSRLRDQISEYQSLPGVGSGSTHTAYLTGRTIDQSAADIHFSYYQRWAVEESINQISNDFMPVINSPNKKLRTYAVNVAILFQNWHTLINRALSPKLNIGRTVTHQELLRNIEDVTFSDSE